MTIPPQFPRSSVPHKFDPSSSHADQPKTEDSSPLSYSRQSKNFFQRATAIVSWLLGGAESQHAPSPQSSKAHITPLHMSELKKYSREEVFSRAQAALDRLELTKEALATEFGESAMGFIFRHIDPVITSSRKLISSLREVEDLRTKEDPARQKTIEDLLEGAVDAVELYAIMNDEEHLKRRIVHHIERHAYQAVQKDIQILISYQSTAADDLAHSHVKAVVELMRMIEHELEPVFMKLEGLPKSFPQTIDLKSIFEWRRSFDEKRHGLVALATLLIDVRVLRYCFFSGYFDEKRAKELGVVNDLYRYVTETQINDGRELLSHAIDLEMLLCRVRLSLEDIHDPMISKQFSEIAEQFRKLVPSLNGGHILTSNGVHKLIEKIDILTEASEQLIYMDEPPIS